MKINSFWVLFVLSILMVGCGKETILDEHLDIDKNGWNYQQIAKFEATIEDTTIGYDFELNMRIRPEYKYSNIWVLINTTLPDGTKATEQLQEFVLAEPSGKWLGDGSSSVLNYHFNLGKNQVMKKGTYTFEIAQNMRTNTLQYVLDIGMKITKGEKIF